MGNDGGAGLGRPDGIQYAVSVLVLEYADYPNCEAGNDYGPRSRTHVRLPRQPKAIYIEQLHHKRGTSGQVGGASICWPRTEGGGVIVVDLEPTDAGQQSAVGLHALIRGPLIRFAASFSAALH